MKLKFTLLNIPHLLKKALSFDQQGYLKVSRDRLTYLGVDDIFIHQLFPLLLDLDHKILKPDYFGENQIGAHISVIYPEENCLVNQEDLAVLHHFKVTGIFTADLEVKRYYALMIRAPSLSQLREKYLLSEQPIFKNYPIEFHITLGFSKL